MKATLSCLTLCDTMDYTVHGILQAGILEWGAFPFSRGSSQPRDRTQVSTLQVDSLPAEPREAKWYDTRHNRRIFVEVQQENPGEKYIL